MVTSPAALEKEYVRAELLGRTDADANSPFYLFFPSFVAE